MNEWMNIDSLKHSQIIKIIYKFTGYSLQNSLYLPILRIFYYSMAMVVGDSRSSANLTVPGWDITKITWKCQGPATDISAIQW